MSAGMLHSLVGDITVGWAGQSNRWFTSWLSYLQSLHWRSSFWPILCLYEFSRWQWPERSWERVVLCGLLSEVSVSLMSGGRSRNTLLTVCFLLDLETAAVWTALSDSLVVSASNGAMVVWCLEYRVCFIIRRGWSSVVMLWHTFSWSRHLTKYCADSRSECSVTFSICASQAWLLQAAICYVLLILSQYTDNVLCDLFATSDSLCTRSDSLSIFQITYMQYFIWDN